MTQSCTSAAGVASYAPAAAPEWRSGEAEGHVEPEAVVERVERDIADYHGRRPSPLGTVDRPSECGQNWRRYRERWSHRCRAVSGFEMRGPN
jgi:hypothetical protein